MPFVDESEFQKIRKISEMLQAGFKYIGPTQEDMPRDTPVSVLDQIGIEEARNITMGAELKSALEGSDEQ